jgi:hypothetical protein
MKTTLSDPSATPAKSPSTKPLRVRAPSSFLLNFGFLPAIALGAQPIFPAGRHAGFDRKNRTLCL